MSASTLQLTGGAVQTLIFLGCLIALYLIILSIYRLTLHPLAKYPGPFFSKISGLSIYLQAITGDRHLILLEEHKRYGSIVRIAPNQLSFSSPSSLRLIYQSGRQNNPLRKSSYYETIDAPSGAFSTHSEVSRTKHAWRRRVLDHAFSDSSLRSAEPFVVENVNDFCKVVNDSIPAGKWSKPHNMSHLCTWLAYDIMGDLVFGKRFDCLNKPDHRYVPRLLMSSGAFVYPIALLPFQSIIRPLISSPTLMSWFGGQLAREGHQYVAYANDRVTERIALQSKMSTYTTTRADMMHHILTARDPTNDQHFTRSDLDAESSLLIAAGADTTSTTLAAAFFYLTLPSSQPALTHLQTQLRNAYNSVSAITSPSITQHQYLRAVIDETLRLAPPVPTHLPRTIVPSPTGGLMVDSHFIPQGTTVGCSAYVLHHDETTFPNSFDFKPERWLVNDRSSSPSALQSPEQVALAKEAFTPFSLGSRGCVGKQLAYIELCISLGRVLWTYNIQRMEASSIDKSKEEVKHEFVKLSPLLEQRRRRGVKMRKDEYQLYDCFLAEREGPWVEFRRWEGSNLGET